MNINTSLISNINSYAGQTPAYIVIHNTDNYAKGANAKAHAKAQHDGNFKGYSAHVSSKGVVKGVKKGKAVIYVCSIFVLS